MFRIIITILLLSVNISYANTNSAYVSGCELTPNAEPDFITLQPIKSSSNLIRKQGAARIAKGNYIILKGKILDIDCVPVSNAIVQIWQADSYGKYEDEYQVQSEWDIRDENYDENFGYSGTALTNNLGEFEFVTIFPGASKLKNTDDEVSAPHINMNIRHREFEEISTRVYFNKHPKNENDNFLKDLETEDKDSLLAKGRYINSDKLPNGREYNINITLEGLNKYRRY